MADLYIHDRVADVDAVQLARRVLSMQARLRTEHGQDAQLKRRPGASDGVQTWMEVYPATVTGFDAALAAAVADAALSELIVGERHTEVFMDLESCA